MFKKYILHFIVAFFIITGCNKPKDDVCISNVNAATTKIEGPTEGLINTEISLVVFFESYNSCGSFESFTENNLGLITEVTVMAKYEGCICSQVAAIKTVAYKFTKGTAGTYHFNFAKAGGGVNTHTVVVR